MDEGRSRSRVKKNPGQHKKVDGGAGGGCPLAISVKMAWSATGYRTQDKVKALATELVLLVRRVQK